MTIQQQQQQSKMESIKINSTILLALIVILSTHSFMVNGQIYKKTDKGFDIDIGYVIESFVFVFDMNHYYCLLLINLK